MHRSQALSKHKDVPQCENENGSRAPTLTLELGLFGDNLTIHMRMRIFLSQYGLRESFRIDTCETSEQPTVGQVRDESTELRKLLSAVLPLAYRGLLFIIGFFVGN